MAFAPEIPVIGSPKMETATASQPSEQKGASGAKGAGSGGPASNSGRGSLASQPSTGVRAV